MVDDRGAGAERGSGEVVLDEAVDADGGGGVAELDAGEEDEGDGEGGGDGGQQLAGGRHGSRLPAPALPWMAGGGIKAGQMREGGETRWEEMQMQMSPPLPLPLRLSALQPPPATINLIQLPKPTYSTHYQNSWAFLCIFFNLIIRPHSSTNL